MKRLIFFVALLSVAVLTLQARDDKARADSLYAAANYKEAATVYQKILTHGDNAFIYYNLGNCYYRMHDIAPAILNYERAANREPGNADIRFNLALARTKTIDKIEDTDDIFLVYWARSVVNWLNSDQWGRLSIVAFGLMLLFFLAFEFMHKLLFRKIGFAGAIVSLVFVVLFNLFAFIQKQQYLDNTHAIVMSLSQVKSAPAESGNVLFALHEGAKVKIVDSTMKQWFKIELSDGKSGWIEKSRVELI